MEARSLSAAQFPAIPTVFRRNFRSSYLPNNRIIKSVSTTQLKSESNGAQFDGPSKKLFILGMGYVGQFFAQELKYQGWNVSGTCTNATKKKDLEQKGYEVHVFDALQPEWKMLDKLRCCTHLLVSIPPDESVGDPMLQHEEYVRTRLVDGNLQWLCYLSSTSVYGDAKGALVNEDYSPKPCSNLAKMRLNAEDRWLNLGQDLGLSTFVLRLGGIYGPARSAIHTILKKEQLSERQKRRVTRNFTSRVHVADICQTLRASISMQGKFIT